MVIQHTQLLQIYHQLIQIFQLTQQIFQLTQQIFQLIQQILQTCKLYQLEHLGIRNVAISI